MTIELALIRIDKDCCEEIVRQCYIFFFFFQAEDGIRDVAVTGVQTCALPIYRRFQAQNTAATYARYLFTDCKDLIIDRNTPIPYPYASAYLKFHFLQHSQLHSSTTLAWFERLDQSPVGDQASTRALTAAVLFRSDLPSILAVNVRFTEAGSNAFMMR